ncbi:MAG: hypothetical protein M3Q91_15490 [Acidobacteriota bacterium]|nr:hypothetical protein [Acidobacteriota bacterium]
MKPGSWYLRESGFVPFDKRVGEAVAKNVEEAAYQTRVARRDRPAQDGM